MSVNDVFLSHVFDIFVLYVVCEGEQEWDCGGNTDLDAFQAADTTKPEMLSGKTFQAAWDSKAG